jgi:hypothetical protein
MIYTVQVFHCDAEAGVAQKISVILEDDMDGGPADETMYFGLDGSE